MLRVKNLPPFFNVVADGVASLEIPLGDTYHRITLELGGTSFTKAMITEIKLKLNSKVFYTISGSRLDSYNKWKSISDSASYLTIDFNEIDAKTPGGMFMGAIGTASGVDSFTAEITIAGATAPTLSAMATVSAGQPLGAIMAMVNHPITFSAGGTYPVTIPHGPETDSLIKRVLLFHSNLTSLKVKKNGLEIFEDTSIARNNFLQGEAGKTSQSGLYVFDLPLLNDMSSLLPTKNANTLELWPTVSGSDTVNLYVDMFSPLAKL